MHVRALNVYYIDGNLENSALTNKLTLCDTCYRLLQQMASGTGKILDDFKALNRLFQVIAKHRSRRMMRRAHNSSI